MRKKTTNKEKNEPKKEKAITIISAQPQFKHKISFKFDPTRFAIISFMFPLLVGFFCFCVYYMQGRYSGYWPTISETGTEYPNTVFFAQFMSTGSLTTMLTLFSYFTYFRLNNNTEKMSKKLILALKILIITASGGITGLGLSPINEAHDRHLMSAVSGFLSILIFEFLVFKNSGKENEIESKGKKSATGNESNKSRKQIKNNIKDYKRRKLRMVCLILATVGFATFAASKFVFSHRIDITVSTVAEWTLLFFMLFMWATWSNELGRLEYHVVLL